jgi:hypothetical protein
MKKISVGRKNDCFEKIIFVALILSMRNFFCYYTFFVSVKIRKIIGSGHTDIVDHRGSVDPKNKYVS